MMIPAPEISSGTEPRAVEENTNWRKIGNRAMKPRKNAPNRVSLLETHAR